MVVHWPKSCIGCGSGDISGVPIPQSIRTYTREAKPVRLMQADFYFCRPCKEGVIKPQIKRGWILMVEGLALFILFALIAMAIPPSAITAFMALDFLILALFGILVSVKIATGKHDLKSGSFKTPLNLHEYWGFNDMYEHDGQQGCLVYFTSDAFAKAFLDANPDLRLQRLPPESTSDMKRKKECIGFFTRLIAPPDA